MTADEPTRLNLVMAWLVLALTVILIALGIAWHGFSADVHYRFWQDIYDRPGGPMSFRFLLQPLMALIVALHDGISDARLGRTPYFHALLTNPVERRSRLGEGLLATARIVLLGLSMDVIYQLKVLDTFYPVEALVIAALLAFVPTSCSAAPPRAWRGGGSGARAPAREPDGIMPNAAGNKSPAGQAEPVAGNVGSAHPQHRHVKAGCGLGSVLAAPFEAFIKGLRAMLSSPSGHERRDVWLRYGRWLVAGLTFQLAADIIETSITTDWNAVGRIAAVAVIRTFLNYFLERDLNEVRERQRESGELPKSV